MSAETSKPCSSRAPSVAVCIPLPRNTSPRHCIGTGRAGKIYCLPPETTARRCCTAAQAGGLQQTGTDGTITNTGVHYSQAPPEGAGSHSTAGRRGGHFSPQLLSRDHSWGRFPPPSIRAGQEPLLPWLWVTSHDQESTCSAKEHSENILPFHPQTPEKCLPAAISALSSLSLRHG